MRDPLVELGVALKARGYSFTAVTPDSHHRVLARNSRGASDPLRDLLGWNRAVDSRKIDSQIYALLRDAGVVSPENGQPGGELRAQLRCASVGTHLYFHSAFPTQDQDSVFFGPDTYRYLRLIAAEFPRRHIGRSLDLGCGTGAGGIAFASRCAEVVLSDVNERALGLARANANINGVDHCQFLASDLFDSIFGDFDLIMSNPPFMLDEDKRQYRDGGGALGEELSLRIVEASLSRLRPGGKLILYTGSAIEDGVDRLHARVRDLVVGNSGLSYRYEEIDPDIFGEELSRPDYAHVERIAAVSLVVEKEV